MKPIEFKEQTKILSKPDGMTDEECGSLAVFNDGFQSISLWQLSWKERFQIFFFGKIWIGVVFGQTQPPIWLSTEKTVFDEPKEDLQREKA